MRIVQVIDLYFLSVMTLIKAVSLYSSPKLREFVAICLASAAYQLSRKKRRLAEKNISELFGEELSEKEKREIVKGNFYEFWKEIFSLPISATERSALRGIEVCGLEHLQAALSRGNGVILWESGTFGRRTLPKQILHEKGFLIHQVHTMHHIGGFSGGRSYTTWVRYHIAEPFFETYEKQFVAEIIYLPNSDSLAFTRRLLDRLKQNAIICITGDVAFGKKLVSRQFLGHTRFFATGMVSLAKMSGATILPMFCFQEENGKVNLTIEPPIRMEIKAERERSLEIAIAQYVVLLESYIRKYPGNYHNWHYVEDHPTEHQINV